MFFDYHRPFRLSERVNERMSECLSIKMIKHMSRRFPLTNHRFQRHINAGPGLKRLFFFAPCLCLNERFHLSLSAASYRMPALNVHLIRSLRSNNKLDWLD